MRFFGNMNRESADWKILEYLEYGAWHVPCPAWLVLWIELQWQSFKPCRCLDSGLAVKFCVGVQEPFCFSFAKMCQIDYTIDRLRIIWVDNLWQIWPISLWDTSEHTFPRVQRMGPLRSGCQWRASQDLGPDWLWRYTILYACGVSAGLRL